MLLHKISQGCRLRAEMRQLLTTAAATAGGDCALKRFRQLEQESKRVGDGDLTIGDAEPQSQMPLCQGDFEAMMGETP